MLLLILVTCFQSAALCKKDNLLPIVALSPVLPSLPTAPVFVLPPALFRKRRQLLPPCVRRPFRSGLVLLRDLAHTVAFINTIFTKCLCTVLRLKMGASSFSAIEGLFVGAGDKQSSCMQIDIFSLQYQKGTKVLLTT